MSKNVKITGKVLAIQLGREETRLVLLHNGSDVLYSTVLTTPMGAVEDGMIQDQDAVRFMLSEALKEPELRHIHKAVFALCTSQAIMERVTTPDLPVSKLEKLILANADMYFPLDVTDYQLAWEVIGPKTSEAGLNELEVQLWALPNAVLTPYYAVANDCGLSIAAIDYCGHSMATVAGASFAAPGQGEKKRAKLDLNMEIGFGKKKSAPEEEEEYPKTAGNAHTDMHILLEQDVLGVTCVQNNQVVFQRFIRCGSNPSYQLSELAMMVDYFRAMDAGRGSSIVGILSGSLTNNRELTEELRDMLSISLGLLDIPYDLRLTCCIGAARTNLDFGIPSLNKLSKARMEMRINLLQYALILLGGVLLISSVFSLLTARLTWNSNLAIQQSAVQELQILSKKYDGYADNYESYIAEYNKYSSDWDSVFASLQTSNDNLVRVLDELEKMLPEDVTVADMQIGATGMNVTFACENKEQAAYMIMALRDMQYADLLAVSSLSGGGAGPAKTYGTGRDNKEQAPVEGGTSISAADRQRLTESLEVDMDPYKLAYYMGMGKDTPDLLNEMYQLYGIQLEADEDEEEGEEEETGDKITATGATYEQRKEAFLTMCTTNPFAMKTAIGMMEAEYPGGEIFNYIAEHEFAKYSNHRNPKTLEKNVNGVLDLIFWNDDYDEQEIFPVVEDIIRRNPEAELWYLYYIEGEMAGENPLPCLDMDKMVDDLADGTFDSADKNVNIILTNLLSGDTKAILEEINSTPDVPSTPTEPSETQPGETEPSSSETTLPPLPTNPSDPFATTDPSETEPSSSETEPTETDPTVTEPTETDPTVTEPTETDPTVTEPTETDPTVTEPSETDPTVTEPSETDPTVTEPSETDPTVTEPSETDPTVTEPSETDPTVTDPTNPEASAAMKVVSKILAHYIETGDTGIDNGEVELSDDEKALIAMFELQYGQVEDMLDEQLENYFTYGGSDYSQFDDVIEDYLAENPEKEEELREKYEKEVSIELALKEYLSTGTTNFDKSAIQKYLRTGDSGVQEYNEKLDAYVKDGKVDAELTALLLKSQEELEKNKTFQAVMENYEAGTGNAVINAQLASCEEDMSDNVADAAKYLKSYLQNGSADPRYDPIIKSFLENGKFEDEELNEIFAKEIKEGKIDEELTALIYLYVYQNKQLQNSVYARNGVLQMLNNYHKSNGTGSVELDNRIKYCYEKLLLGYINKANSANNKDESNGKGSNGSQKNAPVDTRIYFAVVLSYNEELSQAELVRKGLDPNEKIPLIEEVGEE